MSAEKALKAKDKGNNCFKDGQLEESVKHYAEAEKLDLSNPLYPSNLSAALYELGDYRSTLDAILRSAALSLDPALSIKLSTRLAKTLSHGVRDGSISPSLAREMQSNTNNLEEVSLTDSFPPDNAQACQVWRSIRATLDDRDRLSHDAKLRLSRLPIYKGTPDPRVTYFVFGTDEVVSLADDWGPVKRDPIKLRSMSTDQLSQLAFLIAGVGDGRHAFGSIIGLSKAHAKMDAVRKKEMRAHITLLDVHFATIARDLIFFMLIDSLVEGEMDQVTRLEIRATLMYVSIGWAMPDYCYTRYMDTVKDLKVRLLQTPPRLPSWMHVDISSISPILRALDHWIFVKFTTTRFISDLKHETSSEKLQKVMPGMYMEEHANAARALDKLGDRELRLLVGNIPGASAAKIREVVKTIKQALAAKMVSRKFDNNAEWGLEEESSWFKTTKVYVPPTGLIDRHPGFEKLNDEWATEEQAREVAKIVNQSWKPNTTILDGTQDGNMFMEIDAFLVVQQIARFNKDHGVVIKDTASKKHCPAFAHISSFFDAVVDAIKLLKGSIQVEFIVGEINQELSKIRLGTDTRPSHFTKQFTRIWLSNIPNYTHGTLNTAIYVLPALQQNMDAAATSNCLFNSPIWNDDDEFCYNYTLLLPKDLERYLGIRTINAKAVHDILTLSPATLPRPLSSLANRDSLHSWLSRILLSIISPGESRPRPKLIKLPNNLVAFVNLLVQLRNIGYPAHWLSDFVNSILNNTLNADIATYKGFLPRPISDIRAKVPLHRLRLDPWFAELEAILALSHQGLPFVVQIPPNLASTPDAIGLYEAKVVPNVQLFHLPGNDAVTALLFYRSIEVLREHTPENFLRKLPSIIDGGAQGPLKGSFYVMTSQDHVDFTKQEVRWLMSKAVMKTMRQERWFMIAWRMDGWLQTTDPCPVSVWKEVSTPN